MLGFFEGSLGTTHTILKNLHDKVSYLKTYGDKIAYRDSSELARAKAKIFNEIFQNFQTEIAKFNAKNHPYNLKSDRGNLVNLFSCLDGRLQMVCNLAQQNTLNTHRRPEYKTMSATMTLGNIYTGGMMLTSFVNPLVGGAFALGALGFYNKVGVLTTETYSMRLFNDLCYFVSHTHKKLGQEIAESLSKPQKR